MNQQNIQSRQGGVQGSEAAIQARQRKQQRVQECPAVQGTEVTP
jgi:hypothetical protein